MHRSDVTFFSQLCIADLLSCQIETDVVSGNVKLIILALCHNLVLSQQYQITKCSIAGTDSL